jgi:hypothetical protein
MEENQTPPAPNPSAEPTAQPAVVVPSEPVIPTGAAALQPDPSLRSSMINVSPAARAGTLMPTPTEPPKLPVPPVEKEWKSTSHSPFLDGRSVLLYSMFSIVLVILLLTVGIGINIWVKLVLLLVVSVGSLLAAMRAYATDNNTAILLGIIISAIIATGTVVLGSTYVYYVIRLKQVLGY